MKLRKGDKVKVTAGRDKGRVGTIERVYNSSRKVLISKINIYKKHIKKSEQVPQGGVVELPRPLDISKLSLLCAHCGQTTRVGYVLQKDKKVRICKKCKQPI